MVSKPLRRGLVMQVNSAVHFLYQAPDGEWLEAMRIKSIAGYSLPRIGEKILVEGMLFMVSEIVHSFTLSGELKIFIHLNFLKKTTSGQIHNGKEW
jgi:hypothetical protein